MGHLNDQNKIAKYAIIGYPLEHSVSPEIHNKAFKDYGLRAVYSKLPIAPQTFDLRIRQEKSQNWSGFNVTIPYKERIMPFLDWIDETARAIGAVNTIKCEGQRWLGYNTDWLGFLRPIEAHLPALKRCLVLGAGGAARAVVFALLKKAPLLSLTIVNRTIQRAKLLAQEATAFTKANLEVCDLKTFKQQNTQTFDLIVNTTSVGMNASDEQMVLDPQGIVHPKTLVYDLIYKPPKTAFLRRAEALGLTTINGYPMLIYQAEAAFKIWTGKAYLPSTLEYFLQNI